MSLIIEERVGRLFGEIQHYSWGGYSFIPTLIGLKPEPNIPYAEYWIGAHEKAPSHLLRNDGTTIALNKIIKEQPEKTLGPHMAQRYGRLPFLVKVMDVREMLSIQVHPTISEAERGFARENAKGIPLDSPARNYKDENHKPELGVALSDFWLLHGFRPHDELQEVLHHVPEFHTLQPIFASGGYFGLYQYVMEMPQESVNALLNTLEKRVLQQYHAGKLTEFSPDYWVAKTILGKQGGDYDRGIFSMYFFNLVQLKQGQAIYQAAGIPHAYLQGQAIEIMANSDNVVRGGLTPKHIDVSELLRLITCEGTVPEIIEGRRGDNPHELFYEAPNHDFCISRIQLGKGDFYENVADSVEILLLLHGEVILDNANKQMLVNKGESIIVFAGENYRLRTLSEHTVLFRSSIPNPRSV